MEVKTTIAVERHARDRDLEKEEIPKVIVIAVVEVTKGTNLAPCPYALNIPFHLPH